MDSSLKGRLEHEQLNGTRGLGRLDLHQQWGQQLIGQPSTNGR